MKRKLSVLLLVLIMLFTTACSMQNVKGTESSISKDGDIKNVKVTAPTAAVRAGCSDDTSVLQSSGKNTILNVLSKVADWYAVKLPSGKIGFVKQSEATPVIVDGKNKPSTGTTGKEGGTNATPLTPDGTATPKTPGTGVGTGVGPGIGLGLGTDGNPTIPGGTGTGTGTGTGADTGIDLGIGNNAGGEPVIPDEGNANQATLTAAEQEMLRLVNEARAQNNVPALIIDKELCNVARIKSQDMIDNNYFSHNSPTYGSPFDMMKDFGVEYVRAGENIAGNRNTANAHNALMNSPGHRKNILSADFTHIGLGIKDGGPYGMMFCQMFISKPK